MDTQKKVRLQPLPLLCSATIRLSTKLFLFALFLLTLGSELSAQQNCNSVTDPITGCNILYCDGTNCDDLVPADGVFTCTDCMPCGVASPPSDKYACARVELDLTGTAEYMNDPTLSGCSLPVSTQENGNFDIYIVDGSVDCGNPDFVIGDGGTLPINIITGGMVELIICKTGNAGRRDMNIMLSCCDPMYTCTLNDIDEEGCDIPPAFTNIDNVFDISCGTGTGLTMNHMDVGDTDVCGDMDGADFVRTYSLFNAAGNLVATCEQNIIIDDTTPPVSTCPEFEFTVFDCPVGLGPFTPNGNWSLIGPTGTITVAVGRETRTLDLNNCLSDNCSDIANLEITLASSEVVDSEPGCFITITSELLIRDECKNVSDDVITITWTVQNDATTPPSIDCPADDTVECGGSTEPADTGMPTGSSDCGAVVFTYSDNFDPGGCGSGTGVIARTWTATSGCGVTNSCVQVITIVDTTPPSITCPSGATVECGMDTSPNSTGTATGSDGCGGVTITFSDSSQPGCGNTETITRTWKATDDCGLMTTCQQIITVVDNTPPSITCPPDATITCGGNTSPDVLGAANGSDACGGVTITFSDDFDPSCTATTGTGSGIITRTWKATDDCGLMTTCQQIITVLDSPPSITCPPDQTVSCGGDTSPNSTGTATGSDDCGGVTITFSDDFDPACGNTGTITRTWKATDDCGLMTTCDQIITIVDTPPMIDCPADVTIECDEDTSPANTGMATGSDNCGGVTITFTDSFQSDCPNSTGTGTGVITRTWKATDDCGLMITCDQIIIIEDTTPPVIDTPPGSLDVTIDLTDPALCPSGFVSASCYFSNDPNFPISLDLSIDGIFLGNFPGPDPADITDNCELGLVTCAFANFVPGDCITTFDVVWTARDVCGVNLSEPFTQSFTLLDKVAPVFDLACQLDLIFTTENGNVCPADADISLNEGDVIDINTGWTVGGVPIDPLAGCVTDNCIDDDDLLIIVDDITVTGDDCERVITITFLADDGCGNISDPFVCVYTFIDDTPPVVNYLGLPDGATITEECNLRDPNWNPFPATNELTIFDNCADFDDLIIQMDEELIAEGECGVDDFKSIWRCTWTVTDPCDNETTYTLFIRIEDTQGPFWTFFPDNENIECDEEVPFTQATALDNCSEPDISFADDILPGDCPNNYTIRRRWTAVDGCGNPTVRDQLINVSDTTPPVLEFTDEYVNQYTDGQDIFTDCSEFGNIIYLSYAVTAKDNCSANTAVVFEYEDFGLFNCAEVGYSGYVQTTWTSTDECGNTASVVLNWFLVDQTPPTLQGVPEDDCVSTLPSVPNVQAVDDCEFASLEYAQSDPVDCDSGQYVDRTWTATDVCGNTTSATQRLIITDGSGTGPSVDVDYPGLSGLPTGSTAQLAAECNPDGTWMVPDIQAAVTASTGCGSVELRTSFELLDSGDCNSTGYIARYELTVNAEDLCGNTTDYKLFVELIDATPPVVDSPAELVLSCGEAIPEISARDACNEVVSITFTDTQPILASCANSPQSFDRIWTVTDACDNVTVFPQSITIIDDAGPVLSNIPDDACNDETISVPVTAFDECSNSAVAVEMTENTTNEAGCGQVLTRTWTATDACGNTSTATQQVFFADDTAPVLTFAHPLLVGLEDGEELILPVDFDFGNPQEIYDFGEEAIEISDNCASNLTAVLSMAFLDEEEDCSITGYLSRIRLTWTVTDPCGNSAKINIILVYEDTYPPEIFFVPDDLVLYCTDLLPGLPDILVKDNYDENLEAIFSQEAIDTGFGIRVIRRWTATDQCGNSTVEEQFIDIYDNTLECAFDVPNLVFCNSDGNEITVNASGGTAPYTYSWEMTDCDGFLTSDPTQATVTYTVGYTTQNFSVTITDANDCQRVCTISVVCEKPDDEPGGGPQFNAYPNPVDALLTLKFTSLVEKPVKVSIYSLFGQVMFQQNVSYWPQDGYEIDTQNMPNGTYLIKLESDGIDPLVQQVVVLH